jgi:hypothetical protein
MTETHPEKRLIGYARVSTYGQTLDSQVEQLRAAGCSSRNIYREKVTGARAADFCRTGHRRVRAGLGAPPALDDGLHLPRAPRRGDLPVQGPALAKAGDGMLPSDFFHRNVVLSFQEDAIGIRLRDVIGPDNMI